MTREDAINELKMMAKEDNLTLEEEAMECLIMFYDGAGIDEDQVIAEFGNKTKDEIIEAYLNVYC